MKSVKENFIKWNYIPNLFTAKFNLQFMEELPDYSLKAEQHLQERPLGPKQECLLK